MLLFEGHKSINTVLIPVQCDSKGMLSSSVCFKTVPSLPSWTTFFTAHRSCSTPVVIGTEDGGHALSMGIGHARFMISKLFIARVHCTLMLMLYPAFQLHIVPARPLYTPEALRRAQLKDSTVSKVQQARQQSNRPLQPLRHYHQFWSQLNDVLCREYTPNPMGDVETVPISSNLPPHGSTAA